MNIWNCRIAGPVFDTGVMSNALDALEDFYQANINLYPNPTTVRLGQGMILDPLGSPEYVEDDLREIKKTTGDTFCDSTLLALVVAWRTSSATRSGRGRTFMGPLCSDVSSGDGTPMTNNVQQLVTSSQALVAASMASGGWSFGVLSTKTGIFRDFVGSSVKDRFAYLASRRD